jgi:hypothetical protein
MADITMCSGIGCKYSYSCYRYKATPDEFHQSYFLEPPIENDECGYYWEWPPKAKVEEEDNEVE